MPIATRSGAKALYEARTPGLNLESTSVFWPSADSPVRHLDAQIREALAASLERLSTRAGHLLPTHAFDLEAVCAEIRAHRVSPGAVAAYFELVPALQVRDLERAKACWLRIGARPVELPDLRCEAFRPDVLGEDAERYQRLISVGWKDTQLFATPDDREIRTFEAAAASALSLLADALPEWHAEVASLLLRIYGASPDHRNGRGFSGASSRMVWGAVFINVTRHAERLPMVSTLVHEATHQVLFGLSQRQPLTENPPQERYSSPLRSDPRPMDGVYHATYVAARLALFNALLCESPALSVEERHFARARVPQMRQRFEEGLSVVEQHGQLSPLGQQLIAAAAAQLTDFLG